MLTLITKPFHRLQSFVDSLGMYRVVSGSLGILALISIVAGFTGQLAYSGLSQIFALALALLVALTINYVVSLLFKIPSNHESAVITALILFFLAIPGENIFDNWPLVAAVAIGVLSKYIFTYKKQHFMNPAAFGAATLSVTGLYKFSWWVANPLLFIPLVIFGILIVMKVRKWVPVLTFIAVSVIIYTAESMSYGDSITDIVPTFFLSWPTLFLAFFMLTEPFTMPAKKGGQILYGGLMGFVSNSSIFSVFFSVPPELALVVVNILMMPWRLRQKLFLTLQGKVEIARDTFEYIFKKPAGFAFASGQYLEWMLPHDASDTRGVRRYFTIASSPTEPDVRVSLRVVPNGSTYKAALQSLPIGGQVIGSQLAGDFLLPKDETKKLGFIAGGIGITPFRSHVQHMIDSNTVRNTVLYYGNNTIADIAYSDIFKEAGRRGLFKTVYVIAKESVDPPFESGYLNADMIRRHSPDYRERHWYLSGPPVMVNASANTLHALGVPAKHIHKDFFPGLA
jgi:ferredoxin-NADP reductase/Na+-translocating ferredoxin:NAD+ oxidoreductase RnfD subunit